MKEKALPSQPPARWFMHLTPWQARLLIILLSGWYYLFLFRGEPLFLDSKILIKMTGSLVQSHSISISDAAIDKRNDGSPRGGASSAEIPATKQGKGGKGGKSGKSGKVGNSGKGERKAFMQYEGRDKKLYAHYGPGQPFLATILFRIGSFIDDTRSPQGTMSDTWRMRMVMLFNPLVSIILLMLFFELLRDFGLSVGKATWFSLILGLATNLGTQSRTFFLHPLCTMLLIAALLAVVRSKKLNSLPLIVAAGTLCGYAILTRVTSLIGVAGIGCFLLVIHMNAHWTEGKETAKRLFSLITLFGMPVIVFFAIHLLITFIIFGTLHVGGGYQAGDVSLFSGSLRVGLTGFLFSPGRSMFLYSPILLLSLICLPWLIRRETVSGLVLSGVCIAWLIVYSRFWLWFGGDCYGPRYLTELIPLLILPIALFFRDRSFTSMIITTVPLFAVGFFIQTLCGLTPFVPKPPSVTLHDYLFVWSQSQIPLAIDMVNQGRWDTFLIAVMGRTWVHALTIITLPLVTVVTFLTVIRSRIIRSFERGNAVNAEGYRP